MDIKLASQCRARVKILCCGSSGLSTHEVDSVLLQDDFLMDRESEVRRIPNPTCAVLDVVLLRAVA